MINKENEIKNQKEWADKLEKEIRRKDDEIEVLKNQNYRKKQTKTIIGKEEIYYKILTNNNNTIY